ncbi:hypothetical protein B0H34DRAFT_806320 [Crassisporium funariophilum]|nr:hypothetical protein B0H34DRAFT_806320 [Crassisporium funariophilum]
MFPLALLPTIPDSLEKMQAGQELRYQNTFMKNALIRALNIVYDIAGTFKVGSQPSFNQFMDYAGIVCDMMSLHLKGDEVFVKALSEQCKSFRSVSSKDVAKVRDALGSLRRYIGDWNKDIRSYQQKRLLDCLKGLEAPLSELLHNQVKSFSSDAVTRGISDKILKAMIKENMIWLGGNSDISILLPFCMSHHDTHTSKYWPPITKEAINAMPELVKSHSTLWRFAPFDPVTRQRKRLAL